MSCSSCVSGIVSSRSAKILQHLGDKGLSHISSPASLKVRSNFPTLPSHLEELQRPRLAANSGVPTERCLMPNTLKYT